MDAGPSSASSSRSTERSRNQALAPEPLTEHGGRVLVGGREVARLPLRRANGADDLEEEARSVRIERREKQR